MVASDVYSNVTHRIWHERTMAHPTAPSPPQTPEIFSQIPAIDVDLFRSGDKETRQQAADAIHRACRDIGFLYLTNHGVPADLLDRLFQHSQRFFELPLSIKRSIPWTSPQCNCGYIGFQSQHLDPDAPGDRMEAYNIGILQPEAETKWLSDQLELNQTLLEFYQVGGQVCGQIMRAFALSFGLPESFFKDNHDQHYSTVRLLHYPPAEVGVETGEVRAGAHSDYGSITLLFQDDVGGLEIFHNGSWQPAPFIPGTVIVNTGDLMARWTNDIFRSTRHRVVVPPGAAAQRHRYSATFFYRPNLEAEVICLDPCQGPDRPALYPPTTTEGHLISSLRASHHVKD